jgi:hypothetical protein
MSSVEYIGLVINYCNKLLFQCQITVIGYFSKFVTSNSNKLLFNSNENWYYCYLLLFVQPQMYTVQSVVLTDVEMQHEKRTENQGQPPQPTDDERDKFGVGIADLTAATVHGSFESMCMGERETNEGPRIVSMTLGGKSVVIFLLL